MKPTEAGLIVAMMANMPDARGVAWNIETQELFARTIEDLDYESARAAADSWLRTRSERPAIADFRNAVRRQLENTSVIPGDLEFDEAWGFVLRCMAGVGRYKPFPREPHPLVADAVERMGWLVLCDSDNPEADRAHFFRIYAAILQRTRDVRLAAPRLCLPDDQTRLTPVTTQKRAALPAPPANRDQAREGIAQVLQMLDYTPRLVEPRPVARAAVEEAMITDQAAIIRRQSQREKLRNQMAQRKAVGDPE